MNFKKILSLMLALSLAFALAGCGGSNNSAEHSNSGSETQNHASEQNSADEKQPADTTAHQKATVEVADVKVVPSKMGEGIYSAFMMVNNDADNADKIVSAAVKDKPEIRVELHTVENKEMKKVEAIEVPAKGNVELKMGGYHLMLFEVPKEIGEEITLEIKFENAGTVVVLAKIGKAMEDMDQGSMGGHDMGSSEKPMEGHNMGQMSH